MGVIQRALLAPFFRYPHHFALYSSLMRKIGFIACLFIANWLPAQQVITPDYCLDKLEKLQSKVDGFYPKGIFPSLRYWMGKEGLEDNNGFCTASIAYILRTVNERKPDQRVENIIQRSLEPLEKYRSRRGEPAYNFWLTIGDDLPFPNSSLLSRERYRLADDYDDTALIQLARGPHPMDKPVREKMLSYAIRPTREEVAHFPSEHRSKLVYEVWYAAKMQQELDIVVMANVLLFVAEKGYALETPDVHTIACLKTAITEGWYFKNKMSYSQYYNDPANILYNMARLVAKDPWEAFSAHKPLFIKHLRQALNQTENAIEKIMIASSLLKFGESVTLTLSYNQVIQDAKTASFFWYKQPTPAVRYLPNMHWRSEAISWALVYEYLSLDPPIHWK